MQGTSCDPGAGPGLKPAGKEGAVPGEKPLILVDVDGVINHRIMFSSSARRHLAHRHGWRTGRAWSNGEASALIVNPAFGQLLRSLAEDTGAELAWATTWEDAANLYIAPLAGLPQLPVAAPAPYKAKAGHVVPWTGGRPWVWLDDSERELAAADLLANQAGQPHLCVRVNPARGLTAADVTQARAWLSGKPAGDAPAFADVNVPCGDARCPWSRPHGGLPGQRKAAVRSSPVTASPALRRRT